MSTAIKKIKGHLLDHPIGFVEIVSKTESVRFEREEAKQIREQYARYLDSKRGAGQWDLHIIVGEYDIEVEQPSWEQHSSA
jgi:hypothetical protein